jgi:hypothetical protein
MRKSKLVDFQIVVLGAIPTRLMITDTSRHAVVSSPSMKRSGQADTCRSGQGINYGIRPNGERLNAGAVELVLSFADLAIVKENENA